MKLQALLDLHDKNNDCLKDNLGDGFLLQNNRIYSSIRKAATECGFQFSSQANHKYQALPLSQLESILESKIIPYYDNVSVLREVRQKSNLIAWDDIKHNLKRNHLFHESCHAVARGLSDKILHKEKLGACSDQTKILHLLLEESFANTCELLAVIDCEDSAHKIFFELNSYTTLFNERSNLKKAIADFNGLEFKKFIYLTYLHANFFYNNFDDQMFKTVITFCFGSKKLDNAQLKTLRALSRLPFSLDVNFRTVTTGFYLKLQGLNNSEKQIYSLDLIKTLNGDSKYNRYIESLLSIID